MVPSPTDNVSVTVSGVNFVLCPPSKIWIMQASNVSVRKYMDWHTPTTRSGTNGRREALRTENGRSQADGFERSNDRQIDQQWAATCIQDRHLRARRVWRHRQVRRIPKDSGVCVASRNATARADKLGPLLDSIRPVVFAVEASNWTRKVNNMVSHGDRCVNNGPSVYMPDSVSLLEILPPQLWGQTDAARWLLGTVVRKEMYGQSDADGFVRLSSTIGREITGKRTWPKLLTFLGCLFETSPHVGGRRCRGYRIAHCVQGGSHRVRLVEPGLLERLGKYHVKFEKEAESRLLLVHKWMREVQHCHATVDPGIEKELALLSGPSICIQESLVQAIRSHRAGFSVSRTGRVFNCVTGMKRNLRKYVRLVGEPIVGLDIRASQPSLLAHLFTSNGVKGVPTYNIDASSDSSCFCYELGDLACPIEEFGRRLPSLSLLLADDSSEFVEVSLEGGLYELLAEALESQGYAFPKKYESREDRIQFAKRRFLVDVLNFQPSDHLRPMTQLVKDRWPSVLKFIGEANRHSRGTLIASLQRLESWLVIEQVAPRLQAKDIPILSLHDAVYSRERDQQAVRDSFQETFEELNFVLRLKKELPCFALAS